MPVYKNRHGVWLFKVYVPTGKYDSNGEPIKKQVYRSSKKWTRSIALKKEREFLSSIEAGIAPAGSLTFADLYDEYHAYKKPRVKIATLLELESVYNVHLEPYFKKAKLLSINRKKVELFQNDLYNKKNSGRPYANATLRKIQQHLFAMLRYASSHGYIAPLGSIPYIKREEPVTNERRYITENEFYKFISLVDNPEQAALFATLYFTGCRIGEALGLQFKDVDIKKKTININKSYNKRQHAVASTKTKNSIRVVLLPGVLIDYLQKHLEDLNNAHFAPTDFFFPSFRVQSTITRAKDNYLKEARIPIIRLHDFRHSHVSFLINHDFSAFDIAARIGDTVTMVHKVYGHLFASRKLDLVSRIDTIWDTTIKLQSEDEKTNK